MIPLQRAGKLLIFIYLLIWFIGSLWLMAVFGSMQTHSNWLGMNLMLFRNYLIFGLAGSVGGSLYGLRMFHEFYDSLTMRWFYWYLMRPFLCFGSAIITIILFKSGILLLQVGDSMAAQVGIAFLTGFGYGKFMEKLRSLTETFFNGKEKENNGDEDRNNGGK
jgi:hypothetical protein